MIVPWLAAIYIGSMVGISVFGMLGIVTFWFYLRHRHDSFPCPVVHEGDLPKVTIQLPIYNERFVVERLIRAAANMDYPVDKFQIQVLDDSTDDTTDIAAKLVEIYKIQGLDIQMIHRKERPGFKAGALQAAMIHVSGEYIAVFDADFNPDPTFLRQTVPHFLDEPTLGMIQTRWGHMNRSESMLTAAQTIALDKHFAMEQTVRHRANLFPKFNGSAGVWRRKCLVEAGGWEDDTVCEDLCLSTRAILKGWCFRYLNQVVAPAELPRTISAYKNQQSRWAKGSTQCLVKFGPSIAASKRHPLVARAYALLSMAGYTTHLLLLLLLLVQVPLIQSGFKPPAFMILFGLASIAQPMLFVLGQQSLYRDWGHRLLYMPVLLLVAIGLAPSNSRAIVQAIGRGQNDFVRTPKGLTPDHQGLKNERSAQGYRLPFDWIILVEILLAIYATIGIIISIQQSNFWPLLFMGACALGLGYVGYAGIREQLSPSYRRT